MKILLIVLLATTTLVAHAKSEWRIVGGSNAPEGAHPYQISLRFFGIPTCGGTIINRNTILTAAHCVAGFVPFLLSVVVGTNHLSSGGTTHKVASTVPHPDYNAWFIKNDVGIITLKTSIEFNDKVQPIDLETEYVGGGVDCVLSGWGSLYYSGPVPDCLQQITLKTLSTEDCVRLVNDTSVDVDDTQICSFTVKGEGACMGDSGGPLVAKKQIGIVSFGRPCAQGFPDIYTRVSAFYDWIQENKH